MTLCAGKGSFKATRGQLFLFEQGIDRWLRGVQSLAIEETNSTGFGYVDDVNMRSNNKKIGDEILSRTADFLTLQECKLNIVNVLFHKVRDQEPPGKN